MKKDGMRDNCGVKRMKKKKKKRDTRCVPRVCVFVALNGIVGGCCFVSIGALSLVLAAAASGVHTFPVIHFETGSSVERRSSPGVVVITRFQ